MSKNSPTVAVQDKVQAILLVNPFQFLYPCTHNDNIYTTFICKTTYIFTGRAENLSRLE